MTRSYSRRAITRGLTLGPDLASLPSLARAAVSDCGASQTVGDWQIGLSMSDATTPDTPRPQRLRLATANPKLTLSCPVTPRSAEAPPAPDTRRVTIILGDDQLDKVIASTRAELAPQKPSVPIAEKSSEGGISAERMLALLIQPAGQDHRLQLNFTFFHSYNRYTHKTKDGVTEVKDRELWKARPISTTTDRAEAVNMILEHRRLTLALYAKGGEMKEWVRLSSHTLSGRGLSQALADASDALSHRDGFLEPGKCKASGCFLTTACCAEMGRPDDCTELTTLRRFRDGWLRAHPQGASLIAEYYDVAPAICAALARDPRGKTRLRALYWATILPCVAAIRLGANRLALRLYCRMMRRLMRAYPEAR
ncbi:CFI-box-CTERM domain-containing protein [Roseovarius sp.]|uniref:CFI-box-CTERM domain-containing protein n=1 Tax=Roseovarius sp. TaxID=1486281 RepID=UPI00257C8C2A|nr:CFI-box-CTERM domain-containing protein [Roseovarius sp.]